MKTMNYAELNQMSLEDLRMLNQRVIEVIKMKRRVTALDVKEGLWVGATVQVNHPKLMGKELRVEKINRAKASLSVLNGVGFYNVPLGMIEIVK
jgi:hypothetical protein